MPNKSEIAQKLGVTPSALSKWADRNRPDDENDVSDENNED
jgi:predicted transcriptional regulator